MCGPNFTEDIASSGGDFSLYSVWDFIEEAVVKVLESIRGRNNVKVKKKNRMLTTRQLMN